MVEKRTFHETAILSKNTDAKMKQIQQIADSNSFLGAGRSTDDVFPG